MRNNIFWVIFFLTFCIQAQNCKCGNSIPHPPPRPGETELIEIKPNYNAVFKNGKELIICHLEENYNGKDEFYASEFAIYNCENIDFDFGFYSAITNCRINFKNDTLKITELKRLAIGKNWKIKSVDYKTELFYFINDSLHRDEKITIPKFTISQKRIDEFYNFMENPSFDKNTTGDEYMNEYYKIIKKLEILSVYGEKRALQLLKDYGGKYEDGFCCELAETKMFALKMIEKIKELSTITKHSCGRYDRR